MADHHSFATAALKLYQGKIVEVNTAEIKTILQYNDHDSYQKSLIRGRLIEAVGDALVLECNFGVSTRTILINCWLITAMTEVSDGKSLTDFYIDEFSKNYKQ